jgi:4-hydroxy-2-oxoheptanedioate aldolase
MRPNRLRERLNADEPSLSTNALILWPGVVEAIGQAGGFDCIQFEAEYVPFDMHQLDHLGRTIELFDGLSAMIKVEPSIKTHLAQRAIGSGIQNILFADVRTVADAEECVAAVRAESPQTGGHHGSEDRRFSRYGSESGSEAYVQALEDVVIALMIEKKEAVEDLEAILSVRGVDMVVFGPNDYSMSIGKPGEARGPEITKVRDHVYSRALEMGVQPRAELRSVDDAAPLLDLGVRHFSIGSDLLILYAWWQENSKAMRDMVERAQA